MCAIDGQTLSTWMIPGFTGKKIIENKLNNIWWNENTFLSLYRTNKIKII